MKVTCQGSVTSSIAKLVFILSMTNWVMIVFAFLSFYKHNNIVPWRTSLLVSSDMPIAMTEKWLMQCLLIQHFIRKTEIQTLV